MTKWGLNSILYESVKRILISFLALRMFFLYYIAYNVPHTYKTPSYTHNIFMFNETKMMMIIIMMKGTVHILHTMTCEVYIQDEADAAGGDDDDVL